VFSDRRRDARDRLGGVTDAWVEHVRSLLDAPSPAVLATYRKDGSALVTPVWFRWNEGAFEIVIAEGDVKLRHLAANPQCSLVVFETVLPFRGLEVRATAELIEGDVTPVRREIAGRYLGKDAGAKYAVQRTKPGVLVRLAAHEPRVWDLTPILPT
jgi:PPOX class probable F420-dependent enzyme